jgi:DNA-directed RNA polymerase subunit RPC12/RpoP
VIPALPLNVMLVVVAVVALVLYLLISPRYQRCPHCGAFVRRARRGWMRCGRCGRQYHRSVRLR